MAPICRVPCCMGVTNNIARKSMVVAVGVCKRSLFLTLCTGNNRMNSGIYEAMRFGM